MDCVIDNTITIMYNFFKGGWFIVIVKTEMLKIKGGEIPLNLSEENIDGEKGYIIDIDGVEWLFTTNQMHAIVMFQMFKDHILEYMTYEKRWHKK